MTMAFGEVAAAVSVIVLVVSVLAVGYVLVRNNAYTAAREVIDMQAEKILLLEQKRDELLARVASLEQRVVALQDLVTGATAVHELQAHVDVRLDRIEKLIVG